MKTLQDRVSLRMQQLNMSPAELARKINKTQVTVHKILNGQQHNLMGDTLLDLSEALRCNPLWLQKGKGSMLIDNNVELIEVPSNTYPLISWVQAGAWTESIKLPPDEYEYIACPVKTGKRSFWVKVRGDSMYPKFESDDLICIDPEKVSLENDKYVVAMLEGTDEMTFKQLKIIDGQKYLKALNPDYPPEARFLKINGNCRVIGTVVSHVKPL